MHNPTLPESFTTSDFSKLRRFLSAASIIPVTNTNIPTNPSYPIDSIPIAKHIVQNNKTPIPLDTGYITDISPILYALPRRYRYIACTIPVDTKSGIHFQEKDEKSVRYIATGVMVIPVTSHPNHKVAILSAADVFAKKFQLACNMAESIINAKSLVFILYQCSGARRSRTADLLNAIQTRYQLRYNPFNHILSFYGLSAELILLSNQIASYFKYCEYHFDDASLICLA
jgi:hypothetical protein